MLQVNLVKDRKQKTRRCHDRADCHLNRPKSPMARRGKTPVLHLAVETALFPSARPAGEASPKWPSQTQAHTTQVCLYFATVPAAVAGRTCLVTVGSQALTLKMLIGDFGITINGGRGILSHKPQLPNATPEVTKMRIWVSHKAQHTPGSEKARF